MMVDDDLPKYIWSQSIVFFVVLPSPIEFWIFITITHHLELTPKSHELTIKFRMLFDLKDI
jgi:hypothetical protein